MMMAAALRRRIGQGRGIAEMKATLAGGLAALLTVGQGLAAVAPADEDDAGLLRQDDDGSDDEDDKDHDGHNHHPRGRGGRPAGYRHDRGPNMRDNKDDASDSSDNAESTDGEDAPSEGEPAPTEGEAPPPSGAAPVVDDASGGDNIQEGVVAPAASPVPSSSAAPIAAAPDDVDFVS
jgi:hypothetical protein